MGNTCCSVTPDEEKESLEVQLKNITTRLPPDIPEQPDVYRLVIFYHELTSSEEVVSLNQLIAWVDQIFDRGWNIHIVRSPANYYVVTISNRYLNPLEDNLLIYRGRPFTKKRCVVCEDSRSNRILLPCGHLCLCELCVLLHYYPPSHGLSSSSVNPQTSMSTKLCPICNHEFTIIRDPIALGFRY